MSIAQEVRYETVAGAGAYRVGDDGSVWSSISGRWKRLKPCTERGGYLKLRLRHNDGVLRFRKVHHLVLNAFVGPRPEGQEAAHENGDPTDNRAANLRWKSHVQNCADRIRHGRHASGSSEANACLTPQMVAQAWRLRHEGWTHKRIADALGCGVAVIALLLRGKTYRKESEDAKCNLSPG